jgi:hypothetical protein
MSDVRTSDCEGPMRHAGGFDRSSSSPRRGLRHHLRSSVLRKQSSFGSEVVAGISEGGDSMIGVDGKMMGRCGCGLDQDEARQAQKLDILGSILVQAVAISEFIVP